MAKTKRKHLAAIAAMKESLPQQNRVVEFSDDEDQWVEIRKQRVIILIPQLPKSQREYRGAPKTKLPEAQAQDSAGKVLSTKLKRKRTREIGEENINGNLSKLETSLEEGHREQVSTACLPSKNALYEIGKSRKSAGNPAEPKAASVGIRPQNVRAVDVRQIRSKRKWKNGKNDLNKTIRRRRSVTGPTRESNHAVALPMTNMDVLLASVDTINAEQIMTQEVALHKESCELGPSHLEIEHNKGQEALQQTYSPELLIASTQVNNSFDTADSSIQSKLASVLQDDVKAPLEPGDTSQEHCKEQPTMPAQVRKEISCDGLPRNKSFYKKEEDIGVVNVGKVSTERNGQLPNAGSVHLKKKAADHRFVPPILSMNQAFRALTLKKQLMKSGGLSKWLLSVGLDQFIAVFEKRMLNEVELLQLNMDDLKKMGSAAVGPRRKLIWCIHHLSQQMI